MIVKKIILYYLGTIFFILGEISPLGHKQNDNVNLTKKIF